MADGHPGDVKFDVVACRLEVFELGHRVADLPVYREGDARPGLRPGDCPWGAPSIVGRMVDGEMTLPEPLPAERVLVENVPPPPHPGGSPVPRSYDPLTDSPKLFTEFADLSVDDHDAVRAFADRYGMLGLRVVARDALPDNKLRSGVAQYLNAEPIRVWKEQVLLMREAVRVWGLLRREDREALAACLKLETANGESRWYYVTPPESGLLVSGVAPFSIPGEKRSAREDILAAARWVLCALTQGRERGDALSVLSLDPICGLVHRVRPLTLLSAVWHQFAQAVAGIGGPRRCPVCSRWFVVTPGAGRRAERLFCDDYCKLKDYRRRQSEVLALHAEKVKPAVIAKQTRTDLATVKKWIAVAKRGE